MTALTCAQAPAANLTSLISWFREASDADHHARMTFPSSLTKTQRALIHTLVNSVGLGCLEALSEGIADERCISVMRCGTKPRPVGLAYSTNKGVSPANRRCCM